MELQNKSAGLVVIFTLFCFVLIYDESVTSSFNQKYRKSFYSYDKNKLFRYDVIRGIQQATKHFFFFFFWESTRESKENTFCSLRQPIKAQVFLLARGSYHNVTTWRINSDIVQLQNRIMDHEINNDTTFFVSSSMSSYSASSILLVLPRVPFCYTLVGQVTFSRELR